MLSSLCHIVNSDKKLFQRQKLQHCNPIELLLQDLPDKNLNFDSVPMVFNALHSHWTPPPRFTWANLDSWLHLPWISMHCTPIELPLQDLPELNTIFSPPPHGFQCTAHPLNSSFRIHLSKMDFWLRLPWISMHCTPIELLLQDLPEQNENFDSASNGFQCTALPLNYSYRIYRSKTVLLTPPPINFNALQSHCTPLLEFQLFSIILCAQGVAHSEFYYK